MEEQTGTEDALFEASDMEAVANDSVTEQADEENGSAVEETNEQTDSGNDANEAPAVEESTTKTGDAIDEFLAKKGINPSDPNAIRKIADMYRNSEKLAYNKSQETAQLQRQLAQQNAQTSVPNQEALNRVRSLEIQMGTKEWKSTHNLSEDDEQRMVEYINQPIVDNLGNPKINPLTGMPYTKGMLVNNGIMTLDDVYRLSGCGVKQVDDLKANLRKEIENEMAARQAAKRPSSNATNSTQFGKAETEDPFLSGLFGE